MHGETVKKTPLNYLNNEEYFRESSAENQNKYIVYSTKITECLFFL
jgi:hypothetical protein